LAACLTAGLRVKYTLATKLVDELGYMELDRRSAELLFQVLTGRDKNSVAIASNESFSGRRHRRPVGSMTTTVWRGHRNRIGAVIARSEIFCCPYWDVR